MPHQSGKNALFAKKNASLPPESGNLLYASFYFAAERV